MELGGVDPLQADRDRVAMKTFRGLGRGRSCGRFCKGARSLLVNMSIGSP
jgi:hypothetical protein